MEIRRQDWPVCPHLRPSDYTDLCLDCICISVRLNGHQTGKSDVDRVKKSTVELYCREICLLLFIINQVGHRQRYKLLCTLSLGHCATSRKVAGSIPDGVIGIFHWHNPSFQPHFGPLWNAVPSWSCSQAVRKPVWHIPLLCVQWKTPDGGQRNCPKHVEFNSKNKFEKLVHLVGFIIRILTRCTVTWTSDTF
jgi:hypothetical protein